MAPGTLFFRWLLHLYPAAFREEYGDEMTWALSERLRHEPAWHAWPRAVVDLLASATREHVDVTVRDVRVALRGLRRVPTLAAVIVTALALGIGANTAVFAVVRQVLWAPLPYASPERLAVVLQGGRGPIAPATLAELRSGIPAFSDVAGAELWGPTWTGAAHPERLRGMRVSANMWSLLGVPAAIGRTPGEAEARVLVLSDRFWRERFAGDRAVLGRTLVLEGEQYTVVGVMPPDFEFSPFWAKADAWGGLDLAARRDDRRGASLRAFARLRDGASLSVARQQVDALVARLVQQHPTDYRQLSLGTSGLQDRVTGDVAPLLWTLLVAVGCVLLVTCVNVASLLLARAMQRQHEMSVRTALGGRGAMITRQLLTESLVLAGLGALAGLGLAAWLVSIAPTLSRLGLPRLEAVALDWRVVVFAIVTSLATGVLFGLAPVWSIHRGLRLGTRGSTDGRGARRMRGAFVVAQVVIALVLVVAAGLLVRSFARLTRVDPGFDPAGTVAIEISTMSAPAWRSTRGEFFRLVAERMRAMPGVSAAAVVNHPPLAGDAWGIGAAIEGRDGQPPVRAIWRVSGPGFPETLRIPVRDGRTFTDRDVAGAPLVVLVNDRFVREYLPPGPAVGRRLNLADDDEPAEWRTIVGVIADVKQQEWAAPVDPEVHVPLAQSVEYTTSDRPHFAAMTLVARGSDPAGLASAVGDAIWSIDADLALGKPVLLADVMEAQIWRPRFASLLVSGFGLLALLLASTGIYGLVAHDATRRAREIGIRLALGSPVRAVRAMIIGRGMRLVAAGVLAGIAAAWVATRQMSYVLFEVPPGDVTVFVTAAALFLLVGAAASGVPAWRATRRDAVHALRGE
jgi:putative ABC transport system permease protein